MAIEEEFAIEIPDAEADEITTVQDGKCDDIHIMILSVLTFFFFHLAINYVANVSNVSDSLLRKILTP